MVTRAQLKRYAAAVVFGYESVALTTDLVPPLSTPARKHPAIAAVLVAVLVYHLREEDTPRSSLAHNDPQGHTLQVVVPPPPGSSPPYG